MSYTKKRTREETSEQIHTRHKRIKDDHGNSQRVNPFRFDQQQQNVINHDPFSMPLPSDDENNDHYEDDDKMQTNSRSPSNDANDTDLGLLLYELASLDVGDGSGSQSNINNNNKAADAPQTCPICSCRVSLKAFPDHVHSCLDAMNDNDLNDMRTQIEKDSDYATKYALNRGYVTDYNTECPICGKALFVGMGMNEHVNLCMDAAVKKEKEIEEDEDESDDDDEDDDIINDNNNNNNKKQKVVEPLSRDQMIECATKLMTLQQGSDNFNTMLHQFGALGFTKTNLSKVLQIEKEHIHRRRNNNSNHNHNEHNNVNNESVLSPIDEEDDDLLAIDDDDL